MSFYPAMNTVDGKNKAFQLVINVHGEVVIYSLGEDGKPNGFAVTKIGCELIQMLAAEFVKHKGAAEVLFFLDDKWTCNRMLGEYTWTKAASIMNGKSSAAKARMEGKMRFVPHGRYMKWEDETQKYVVTDIGQKLDALHAKPSDANGNTGG